MERTKKKHLSAKRKLVALALVGIIGAGYMQLSHAPLESSEVPVVERTDDASTTLLAYTRPKGYNK